ncbi:glycosyltransferase family 4 protein [Neptuniibacter halophilus]|uniref:glycosyltransferase family 4 protein n=1 Tax=Neptuniibacter halophilus TaxID=651666 RepID=UPI0025743AE8|nr:glycosyltransferase family 4 protein [Neptuniibacter halophilus]
MLRVLVIGYVWPEPDSSAAGRHILSLLRLFRQQHWQVTFASAAQPTEHMTDLSTEGVESRSIHLNCSSFDQFIAELQPDLVMFDRFMTEEQYGWRVAQTCPQALRVLDTEDLQCLRKGRHQALKQSRELTQEDLCSEIALREIAAIYRSDLSLIISDYEMTLLLQRFAVADSLLHHLPFMLDADQLDQPSPDFSERQHCMMIGNFRHPPNWDSVLQMQHLWPLIRRELISQGETDPQLHIYGSYPPPKATAMHNPGNGFLIKGWAEDACAVMRQARLCLAPLRFGAGIKGKLLEAMLCGTPSVTSPIGAEGMTGADDPATLWPGAVCDSDAAFIDATVKLYTDATLWQERQQRGHALLHQRYNGAISGPRLIERLLELRKQLACHRLNNFTGAMLQHHSMKSTQYMSQWIEAKNRDK